MDKHMIIYLLNEDQVKLLQSLNTDHKIYVPCDYGYGPCIEKSTLDNVTFSEHKDLVNNFGPLEEVEVTLDGI